MASDRPIPVRRIAPVLPVVLLPVVLVASACGASESPAELHAEFEQDSNLERAEPGSRRVDVEVGKRVYLLNGTRESLEVDGVRGVDLSGPSPPAIEELTLGERALRTLTLAAGSEFVAKDVLPYAGMLRFDVGFADPEGAAPHGFRLSVAARGAAGEEPLWSAECSGRAGGASAAWEPFEVDLTTASGTDLVLRTEALGGGGGGRAAADPLALPRWGNPMLVGGGRRTKRLAPRVPNVIVFLVDTLRADRLGTYGYERAATPVIDRLAAESLVFERAYATSSWTKPSVASLFTSRAPHAHRVHGFEHRLGDSETTLAEVVSDAGFRTAAFGTSIWIFAPELNYHPGFDDFVRVYDRPTKQGPMAEADVVVDEVVDWLERYGEEPFWLYVHVADPHTPYVPAPGYEQLVGEAPPRPFNGEREGPSSFRRLKPDSATEAELSYLAGLYDAEVAFVDAQLGRLIGELERLGAWDETALILVSDHGEEFLDHGSWEHGETLYEESVHIPLIVKPPASFGVPAARNTSPVSLLDVAPTVCEILGVPVDGLPFQGRSLLQAVDSAAPILTELELQEHEVIAIVDGPWKYLSARSPATLERAFRLDVDPQETRDVLGDVPSDRLGSWRANVQAVRARALPPGLYIEVSAGSEPLELRGLIRCEEGVADLDVIESEVESVDDRFLGDQAFYPEGHRRLGAFGLEVGPGDPRDLVRFNVPPGSRVGIGLQAVEGPLPPAWLGAVRGKPVGLPVTFREDSPELAPSSAPGSEESPGGRPARVRIFRVDRQEVALDEARLEQLRALGYGADD